MKTRKSILMVLGLVLLLGGSYAFYTYQKYSGMQNLLNGEIYLNYLEDNEVHISGIFPETKEEALKRNDNTISFKVLSKNTSDKDIYYGITLNYGEEISNKVRIDAKYIMIYLECDGKVLIDGIRYSDFNNRRIYVDKIDAKTYTETTKNYTLRFWVDEETTISDTDSNASYKATEWANSYLNFKVNVDAGLETMNMPLSMETSDTYVENNKAYFIAKISNFINIEDLGKDSNDTMNLKVTGTNSDIKFSYKDSEGNTVEEKSDTLDLTYLFTKNKTVEIQVFVHPNNDANGKTNVLLKIYKNKELMQSFIKRAEVKGNNYCLNNGFNKLVDCMLVSDSLSESVDVAKTNISDKGEPNLNDTAPSYTYIEQVEKDVDNPFSVKNYRDFYFSKTYEFDESNGTFKLTGEIIEDYLSDDYIGYYTVGNAASYGTSNVDYMYKISKTETVGNEYIISKGDKYSYKIASSIRSEVGLYKNEDDYGDVYYYRGDVQNNNVYFEGYYWKIVRTNGDGSVRLIYSGNKKNAEGIDLSINSTKYLYNQRAYGPWFAGYMYGESDIEKISDEVTYARFNNTSSYVFAKSYTYDEETKLYKLSGDYKKDTIKNMREYLGDYPITCGNININATCTVILKVNSYVSETSLKIQYIGYVPSSLEKAFSNEIESDVKKTIDKWYEDNFVSKKDSNNSLITDYFVDGTFCNDRSITHSIYNSGYKIDKKTYFAVMNRIQLYKATLKCPNKRDMFSVTSDYGNAKLKYPIALITADELAFAGGMYRAKNANFYLSPTSLDMKTMSPAHYNEQASEVNTMRLNANGGIHDYDFVDISNAVRPVINIRGDVVISSGDGTANSPYQLKLK